LNGTILNGSISMFDPLAGEKKKRFIQEHDNENVEITIKVIDDIKTLEQMRFYRGVVLPAICDASGHKNREEVHAYLKSQYLSSFKEMTINNQYIIVKDIPSLKDISKEDFRKFIDHCLEFLADVGGSIPHHEIDRYETTMQS